MTKYVFTRDRKGQGPEIVHQVLRDDAAATQYAVIMGYDTYAEADAADTATEFDFKAAPNPGAAVDSLLNEPTEIPEGIDGADYVLTAIHLSKSAPLPLTNDQQEQFADQAAIVTEDIHRIIIGLRKDGISASFAGVLEYYAPKVVWLSVIGPYFEAAGPSYQYVKDHFAPVLAAETNMIDYDVTKTIEITLPVRARDKAEAINSVNARDLAYLVGMGSVKVFATSARTHV